MKKLTYLFVIISTLLLSTSIVDGQNKSKFSIGDTVIIQKRSCGLHSSPSNWDYINEDLSKGSIVLIVGPETKGFVPIETEENKLYFIKTKHVLTKYEFNETEDNRIKFEFSPHLNKNTSQIVDDKIDEMITEPLLSAGDELIKFKNRMYTGYGLMFTGGVISYLGARELNNNNNVMVLGGITGLLGFILTIEAVSHIGKAGVILNENGVGLAVPLNN